MMNKILFLSLIVTGLVSGVTFAQVSPAPAKGSATGVEGVISAGPVHGGPVRQGGSDSRPLPNMTFEVKQGSRVLTSFQTDDQGRFRILLEPGHYTITRKDYAGAIGSYGPFETDVSQGKMTSVRWDCDTGLR